MSDRIETAKAVFRAYADGDRDAIEKLIGDDFHFTSPLDNRIDRATYFERCWPNHSAITGFDFIHVAETGARVFVTYEGHNASGKRFRNTEILTVRDGKVSDVEVYFGWSVPHEAERGTYISEAGGSK